MHALVENLFIYDPLDEVDLLYYSGGLTRKQLLEKIDQMPSIAQGENYFSTVITANDEKELRKICDGIAQEIQESLDHHLYRDVNFLLKHVYRIRKIDHPIVEDLIGECKNLIIKHFQSLIQEVDEELLRDSSTLSEKAKKIVDVISVGISSFEGEDPTFFAEKIGLEQLKKKYSNHEKTIQFWQFESQTKLLVAEFRQKCSNGDLAGAQTLLSSIENRVIEVNKDFASQQLSSTIDAHDLRTQFEKLRTMKNQLEAMQFKHQQEAAANRDQILALEANRAEEKRRFEAAQADQERQANALFAQLNSL